MIEHPTIERISKFLTVLTYSGIPESRGVMSNDHKIIAVMTYYKPWRRWVLAPESKTVWSADCLVAIKDYLDRMNRPDFLPAESVDPMISAAPELIAALKGLLVLADGRSTV